MREAHARLDNFIGCEPVMFGVLSPTSLPWSIVIGKMFHLGEESYKRYRRVEKFRTSRKYKKMYKYC